MLTFHDPDAAVTLVLAPSRGGMRLTLHHHPRPFDTLEVTFDRDETAKIAEWLGGADERPDLLGFVKGGKAGSPPRPRRSAPDDDRPGAAPGAMVPYTIYATPRSEPLAG